MIHTEKEQNLNKMLNGDYDSATDLFLFKTERLFDTGDAIDHLVAFE